MRHLAAILRRLADRLDPPEHILDRARAARLARYGPHPSLLRRHPNLADLPQEHP